MGLRWAGGSSAWGLVFLIHALCALEQTTPRLGPWGTQLHGHEGLRPYGSEEPMSTMYYSGPVFVDLLLLSVPQAPLHFLRMFSCKIPILFQLH